MHVEERKVTRSHRATTDEEAQRCILVQIPGAACRELVTTNLVVVSSTYLSSYPNGESPRQQAHDSGLHRLGYCTPDRAGHDVMSFNSERGVQETHKVLIFWSLRERFSD